MKKYASLVFTLIIGFIIFAITVSASSEDNLTYDTKNGQLFVIGCNDSATAIVIPEKVNNRSVEVIGAGAFKDCISLESVVIPSSVKIIESEAFKGCINLEEVTFEEESECTKIESSAFEGCSLLKSITVPSKMESIGGFAFQSCDNLVLIKNDSKLSIFPDAWKNGGIANNALKIVSEQGETITEGYEKDENGFVFYPVTINGVKKYRLVGYVGEEDTVTLPLTYNGQAYEIESVKGVNNIIVPNGVKTIGTAIKSSFKFNNCANIKSVTIPSSVTDIKNTAFSNCHNLKKIQVDESNLSYTSDEQGILYSKDKTTLVRCPQQIAFVDIPACVKTIESYAFEDCKKLKSVFIPSSVTDIGELSFSFCDTLENVIFEKGSECKLIGEAAFYSCTSIKCIDIPSNAMVLGPRSFANCSELESIVIPSKVIIVGDEAFRNCKKIKIYGYEGSEAERYAKNAEISFTKLEKEETVPSTQIPFVDVIEKDWYYGDVKTAYELGLINGKGNKDTFKPNDNMTYAEAIKLAACMHQLYTNGKITLTNGNPWYQSYVDYAVENKIIDKEYSYGDIATRAGYMEIFSRALPDSALELINDVPLHSIPDVSDEVEEREAIYKLYRVGIVAGVDSKRNCNPYGNIKRCEVAVIINRMMNKGKRITFSITAD